jgi:hypothetical protein
VEIEEFGNAKEEWFKSFLEPPNGIPSHDTFNRVFGLLKPKEFQSAFTRWTAGLWQALSEEIVAIDGKSLRRSRSKDHGPIHMVSAWAARNRLVLGQVKVEEKTNEITAIPELLRTLQLKGCIVTIDANGLSRKTLPRRSRKSEPITVWRSKAIIRPCTPRWRAARRSLQSAAFT